MSPRETRVFVLGAASIAIPSWNLGFELGVYRTIFFDHFFGLGATSLAVFVASLIAPREHAPVGWLGRLMLILPWTWILVAVLFDPDTPIEQRPVAQLLFGVVIYLVSLPFIAYTIGKILDAELVRELGSRSKLKLFLVAACVTGAAFAVGDNHALFLSAYDFEVSGNMVPRR